MNGNLKPLPGMDHGTPPLAVLQQQAEMEAMLQEETSAIGSPVNGQTAAAVEEVVAPPVTEDAESRVPARRRLYEAALDTPRRPVVRVILEYMPETKEVPSFKLEFDVGEVCVREHYISLLVVSDMGFKPTTTMRFKLTVQDGSRVQMPYVVIFAGAEFEFKTVKVRGISFLRDKKAEVSL